MLQLERLRPGRSFASVTPTTRRVLVINGHPEVRPDLFCDALCDAWEEGARAGGCEVERLNARDFDSAEALAKIRWGRQITVMFPLRDNRPPPVLRCLFERYAYLETLDTFQPVDHSVQMVALLEMPAFAHRALLKSKTSALRRSLSLPGLFCDDQILIGGVMSISDEQRIAWLQDMRRRALHCT